MTGSCFNSRRPSYKWMRQCTGVIIGSDIDLCLLGAKPLPWINAGELLIEQYQFIWIDVSDISGLNQLMRQGAPCCN